MEALKFVGGFLIGVCLVVPATFFLRAVEIYFGPQYVPIAAFVGFMAVSPEVVRFCSELFRTPQEQER